MDDTGDRGTQCMEAQMDASFWIELLVLILRVFAAGAAG
jgi:hypothetical protein